MEMAYHLVYVKDFLKFIFNKISSKAGAKFHPGIIIKHRASKVCMILMSSVQTKQRLHIHY